MSNNKIETERLILRKAKKSDLDNIWHNIWKDDDIAKTMLWQVTKTKQDAIVRLEKTIKYQSSNYAYFICLKESDEAIGFVGVFEQSEGVFEDSGLCIAKKYQNNGYAKEVIRALIKFVFEDLKGKRFLYSCFRDNAKSRKVCLANGFKYLNSVEKMRDYDNYHYICDYYYLDKE